MLSIKCYCILVWVIMQNYYSNSLTDDTFFFFFNSNELVLSSKTFGAESFRLSLHRGTQSNINNNCGDDHNKNRSDLPASAATVKTEVFYCVASVYKKGTIITIRMLKHFSYTNLQMQYLHIIWALHFKSV